MAFTGKVGFGVWVSSDDERQEKVLLLLVAEKNNWRRKLRRGGRREKDDEKEIMNWIQRKVYLYNVTLGLYMLDFWERELFNTLIVVLMWFIFHNGSRHVTEFCKSSLGYGRSLPSIEGHLWGSALGGGT